MGERMVFLINEALRLHTAEPRPVPGLGLGRACATQVVEHLRLSAVTDWLWLERERQPGAVGTPLQGLDGYAHWRISAYFALRRRLLPYYRAALDRNITWLLPLKNRLKRALLQRGPA